MLKPDLGMLRLPLVIALPLCQGVLALRLALAGRAVQAESGGDAARFRAGGLADGLDAGLRVVQLSWRF